MTCVVLGSSFEKNQKRKNESEAILTCPRLGQGTCHPMVALNPMDANLSANVRPEASRQSPRPALHMMRGTRHSRAQHTQTMSRQSPPRLQWPDWFDRHHGEWSLRLEPFGFAQPLRSTLIQFHPRIRLPIPVTVPICSFQQHQFQQKGQLARCAWAWGLNTMPKKHASGEPLLP